MTFPREGKFTSSHFFASKDGMGVKGRPKSVQQLRDSTLVARRVRTRMPVPRVKVPPLLIRRP